MFNIHCICHRLALACADRGDDYKFIQNVEEILIELWRFFKNTPKRLHIYIKVTLSAKEFDSLTEKKKKNYVKLLKKICRTRWLSLHAGIDVAFGEYTSLIYSLKEIQNDKASGSTASRLLKKISHYEFLGMLYLLKNILPSLTELSKTFQIGSLNFLRILPAINRCKSKILEVAKDYRVIQQLKEDLNGRLKELNIVLKGSEEIQITNLVEKYTKSMCNNIEARFPQTTSKILESFEIFDIELLPMSSSPSFCMYGKNEISFSAEKYFPEKSVEIILADWEEFKFELIDIKKKYQLLKENLTDNNLKLKKTASEWALQYIVKGFREDNYIYICELTKVALITPVTNGWPERGASAVKRVKSRM